MNKKDKIQSLIKEWFYTKSGIKLTHDPSLNSLVNEILYLPSPADPLLHFINRSGWIDYSKFNEWMTERGFDVIQLKRHNRTDGEVHFRYKHKILELTCDFNGNYYNGRGFSKIIDWLNQNEL